VTSHFLQKEGLTALPRGYVTVAFLKLNMNMTEKIKHVH